MINKTRTEGEEMVNSTRTPQSLALQAGPWDKIPTEMIGSIMQYLSRNDLKPCRLVDKRTSHEAARALFRTIVFAPSMTSVDKINKLAHDPRFACYVQVIDIHRYPIRFTDFERALDSSFEEAEPEAKSRMKQAFKDEVDASRQFLAPESSEQASELWQKFSQLRHVFFTNASNSSGKTDDFFHNGRLKEDCDLFRRTGVRLLHDRSHYFDPELSTDILLVSKYLQHTRPRVLEMSETHWQDFSRRFSLDRLDRDTILPMLSEVKRFKLTFRNWFNWFDSSNIIKLWEFTNKLWRNLSMAFPQLQDLWLGFDGIPPRSRSSTEARPQGCERYIVPATMIKSLLFPQYSRLVSLTLENVCTSLTDLQDFIRRHATTLKTIRFENLLIDGERFPIGKILGSMMKLILFLHNETALETMSFEGCFSDHENKGEILHCAYPNRPCLLRQVENYICHRGEFPFKVLQPYLKNLAEGQFKVSDCGKRLVIGVELNNAIVEIEPGMDSSWFFTNW